MAVWGTLRRYSLLNITVFLRETHSYRYDQPDQGLKVASLCKAPVIPKIPFSIALGVLQPINTISLTCQYFLQSVNAWCFCSNITI